MIALKKKTITLIRGLPEDAEKWRTDGAVTAATIPPDRMRPIISETMRRVAEEYDNGVVWAVLQYGFDVDKERLARALNDARSFYEEGWLAAVNSCRLAPVVHGEWNWVARWECSLCKHPWPIGVKTPAAKYCPNCGAKMDGGKSDEANFGK